MGIPIQDLIEMSTRDVLRNTFEGNFRHHALSSERAENHVQRGRLTSPFAQRLFNGYAALGKGVERLQEHQGVERWKMTRQQEIFEHLIWQVVMEEYPQACLQSTVVYEDLTIWSPPESWDIPRILDSRNIIKNLIARIARVILGVPVRTPKMKFPTIAEGDDAITILKDTWLRKIYIMVYEIRWIIGEQIPKEVIEGVADIAPSSTPVKNAEYILIMRYLDALHQMLFDMFSLGVRETIPELYDAASFDVFQNWWLIKLKLPEERRYLKTEDKLISVISD